VVARSLPLAELLRRWLGRTPTLGGTPRPTLDNAPRPTLFYEMSSRVSRRARVGVPGFHPRRARMAGDE